jgi:thiol:disulfide interchange protein DsbD
MERFKTFMGFPMLATAFWLFTLTIAKLSSSEIFWFGVFLIVLAMAAWIWGQFVQRGSRRRVIAAIISLVLIAGFGSAALHKREKLEWQPWSPEAVQSARAQGRPVFVDFTAAWCVNCNVNKATSIEIDSVRKKLAEVNAVILKGDYTDYDEQIAKELQAFGRGGVPLNVIYPKDTNSAPIVLPPTLTPGIVLDALEKAANG